MIEINIKKILEIVSGILTSGNEKFVCDLFVIDSREVTEKSIFLPVIGEVQDGHIFIVKAFENKVKYSFCENNYYINNKLKLKNKNLILVENTTTALHDLTKYILNECNVKTVGITGSLGKTSTKEMVYCILNEKYNVHKNKGNLNNHIGLPLTVFDLKYEHDICVLEMGMNHFKEIETLVGIVKPDIGVITNIGTSHIGNLGSQDGIFEAKMEIVTYFEKENTLVINGNDSYLNKIISSGYNILKTGVGNNFKLKGYDLKLKEDVCYSYKLNYDLETYTVNLNVLGKHNVNNSLLAIGVGLSFGVSISDCIIGLSKFRDNDKRLEIIKIKNNNTIISDCYNASSESIISAIDVLEELDGNRKIAVLGDVLELGGFSKESHEKVGEYLSLKKIDYVLTFGEASKYIKSKAVEKGFKKENIFSFLNQEELIKKLMSIINFEDVILIKGSQGMEMNKIVNALID